MADREYIIEILLKARDDTARALASAAGNLEAYDKLLDEQRAKNDALVGSNGRLAASHLELSKSQAKVAKGQDDIIAAQGRYQKSAEAVARTNAARRKDDIASNAVYVEATRRQKQAELDLADAVNKSALSQRLKNEALKALPAFTDEAARNALYKEQSRILQDLEVKTRALGRAQDAGDLGRIRDSIVDLQNQMGNLGQKTREVDAVFAKAFDTARAEQMRLATERNTASMQKYYQLLDNVAKAEKKRDAVINKPGLSDTEKRTVYERLDLSDVRPAKLKLDAFIKEAELHRIHLPVDVRDDDLRRARQTLDASMSGSGGGGSGSSSATSGSGFFGSLKKAFGDLDTSTSGFDNHIRNAFGFAIVGLIQPLAGLIVGLVGSFTALASAAIAAGSAMGGIFMSSIAQGIPVLGLFGASMQRLTQVFSLVTTLAGQQQQKFLAAYQTAYQNSLGINQVTIAEHSLSDALFAVTRAQEAVQSARLSLMTTEQAAVRQLQDLVFAEDSAKLAAEGATLSVIAAQKALQEAVASGGDVAGAQLALQQAQLGQTQAIVQQHRAVADAAGGSLARQNIQQGVTQAQRAVIDSQRAVVDAGYQVASAAAAVTEAKQAAAGFNVQVAGTIAWLKSQMSSTEKALANNILRIYNLFRGVNGRLRPLTDQILGAFLPLTDQIYKLFENPRVFSALSHLAGAIGDAIRTVTKTIFSKDSINTFISLINDATKNMKPLAILIGDFFKSFGAIAKAAAPIVHEFLLFLDKLVGDFAKWANSTKGQNWLKKFFEEGLKSLEAFIKLGVAIAELIAAVVGVGGGAKTGIGLLDDLRKHIDAITKSINDHGHEFDVLQKLWASAKPALSALGEIFGAIGHAFLSLGSGSGGQNALKSMADLIAHVLIPAFVTFASEIGFLVSKITNFIAQHPALEAILSTVLGTFGAIAFAFKGIGLIFGPFAAIIGLFSKAVLAGRALLAIFEGIKAFLAFRTAGQSLTDSLKGAAAVAEQRLGTERAIIAAIERQNALLAEQLGVQKDIVGVETEETAELGTQNAEAGTLDTELGVGAGLQTAGGIGAGITGILAGAARILPPLLLAIAAYKAVTGFIKPLSSRNTGVGSVLGNVPTQAWADPSGIGPKGVGIGGHVENAIASIPIVGGAIHDVMGWLGLNNQTTVALQNLQKGLKGVQSPLDLGNSKLKILYNQIVSTSRLPDLTKAQRNGLFLLQQQFNPANVALEKFKNNWKGVFSAINATTGAVWPQIKQVISTQVAAIDSNLKHGSVRWKEAITTSYSSAIEELKKLNHQGLLSTQHMVDDINKLLRSELGKLGLLAIPKGINNSQLQFLLNSATQGTNAPGNPQFGPAPPGLRRATGGPIGGGYGGGDRHATLLESGEHVFSKEEVRAAGGHGAIFALRRLLGGGGQGGPRRFATGGAVQQALSPTGSASGASIQGVGGPFGVYLATILLFIKDFQMDWKNMWTQVGNLTKNAVQNQEQRFKNLFKNLNNQTTNSLQTFTNTFAQTLNQVTSDVSKAFTYIVGATNSALKSFGAKPVNVTLGSVPKFAGGGYSGFVGNMGERGKDLVHALLGRGEAVLNWGHQRMVEPAMRAYYGYGLGEMFGKVKGEHAGGGRGFAAGGYIYPFPPGTVLGRTDQGVDASMPVGAPIGPMGRSRIGGIIPDWFAHQPLIFWQLLDGARKGAWAYVAEQITNLARPGSIINANQAVANYASSGTEIEYGWSTSSGATQARVTSGYSEGQVTPSGSNMRAFLAGLSHGKITGGAFGALGGAAGATWNAIKDLAVKGSGPMHDLVKGVIDKVTGAANAFGNKKAGQSSGVGGFGSLAKPVGNIMALAAAAAKSVGLAFNAGIVRELLSKESSGGLNEPPSGSLNATGPFQVIPSTFASNAAPGHTDIRNPWDNALAAMHYIKGTYGSLAAMAAKTGLFGSGYVGYKGGGIVPILAHAGEWVINKGQQLGLAGRLGTTVGNLKRSMGFTGGPVSYQGGGEVGFHSDDYLPVSAGGAYNRVPSGSVFNPTPTKAPTTHNPVPVAVVSTPAPTRSKPTYTAPASAAPASISNSPLDKLVGFFGNTWGKIAKWGKTTDQLQQVIGGGILPTTTKGAFSITGDVPVDLPSFYTGALNTYIKSQHQLTQRLTTSSKKWNLKLEDELNKWLANYNLVGGDNGLFALAAQAVADFATQTQTTALFIAAGVRQIGQRLKFGRAASLTRAAQADLNSTLESNKALEGLQREQATSLKQLDAQLKRLGKPDKNTLGIYTKLIADRQDLINQLRNTDSQLAQGLNDQYNKAIALFQAQTTAAIRKPTLIVNAAQLANTIAQAFGRPADLLKADSALVSGYSSQVTALQKAYEAASKKAAKDPRWQATADDLLSQLQSAIGSAAQAQAQALSDQITQADTAGQIQQSRVDMANRLQAVLAATSSTLGPANQLQAAQNQIGVSRLNAAGLTSQLSGYQNLYAQASAQGNVGAMQTLTQTMNNLTAQIAEANLQTAQLITAYHQLAVTIMQAQTQATSSFFSAATSISQTLGAIAGNQNLPALINYATETAKALMQQGQEIVKQIQSVISDPKAFGAASGQASGFLSQLVAAFNEGPQVFANTLASLAPQLATFEAGLPQDQQALFQSLVQELIDNTTSLVSNTQQLQLLNATTNQQQFASSAWTLFGQAIFNGLGQLLPQFASAIPQISAYASAIPAMDVGGMITKTGVLLGHAGETITPASVQKGPVGGGNYGDLNVHVTNPTEVADPVYLGNQIAWRLAHNPNSR